MARKNLLTDCDVFRFKDMELHGQLTGFSDSHKPRNAVHEFLKRDGAQVEYMGRGPRRFKFNLVFLGKKFRAEYKRFIASMDADPYGTLVHPLLGQVRAIYDGADASVDIPRELDTITMPVSFLENDVDVKLEAAQAERQSVSEKEQAVTTQTTAFTSALAIFTSAEAIGTTYVARALSYASAAATAARESTPDPSLSVKLDDVRIYCQSVIVEILADDEAEGAAHFDAISNAEMVYSACLELDEAASALRPPILEYAVQGQISMAALLGRLYGKDALSRLDEFLTLNRIANPAAIPSGTVVRYYPAS